MRILWGLECVFIGKNAWFGCKRIFFPAVRKGEESRIWNDINCNLIFIFCVISHMIPMKRGEKWLIFMQNSDLRHDINVDYWENA